MNLKIAVLSDPHLKTGLMDDALKMLLSKDAQYIIHAGDFQIKENLELLHSKNLPYVSVFGNNDMMLYSLQNDFKIYKEPYYFKIKDFTFKLMHLPYYMTGDTDIVISGHTHIFKTEFINNTLFLNPGEICAREKPLSECVLLEITQNEYIVYYYFKEPSSKSWDEKIYSFIRTNI
jgi:putative phosphoesterase